MSRGRLTSRQHDATRAIKAARYIRSDGRDLRPELLEDWGTHCASSRPRTSSRLLPQGNRASRIVNREVHFIWLLIYGLLDGYIRHRSWWLWVRGEDSA